MLPPAALTHSPRAHAHHPCSRSLRIPALSSFFTHPPARELRLTTSHHLRRQRRVTRSIQSHVTFPARDRSRAGDAQEYSPNQQYHTVPWTDAVDSGAGGGLRALIQILRGGAFGVWVWNESSTGEMGLAWGRRLGVRRQREDRERLALQESCLDRRRMGDNSYGMSALKRGTECGRGSGCKSEALLGNLGPSVTRSSDGLDTQ